MTHPKKITRKKSNYKYFDKLINFDKKCLFCFKQKKRLTKANWHRKILCDHANKKVFFNDL